MLIKFIPFTFPENGQKPKSEVVIQKPFFIWVNFKSSFLNAFIYVTGQISLSTYSIRMPRIVFLQSVL